MREKLENVTRIIIFFLIVMVNISDSFGTVQLMPPIQEITVQRGYTKEFTFTVKNNGNEDMPSSFAVHDMDVTLDGRPVASDSSLSRGCKSWISLTPEECIIKAHESIELKGTVNAPKSANGGYYVVIKGSFISTNIPLAEGEQVNNSSSISILSEAMVVLMVQVPSSRSRPVIVPDTLLVFPAGEGNQVFDFDSRRDRGWKVTMPVHNEGTMHARVSGHVSFWSESGVFIDSKPFKAGKGYVIPGKVRNLSAQGDNNLEDGYYMMRIYLQTDKKHGISKSFPFAIYEGDVYPGAITDKLSELIRASSPGFILKDPFIQKRISPG